MRNEIIFDNKGFPDIMVAFAPNELGLPSELKGRKVEAYLIGKYAATMIDGTPYSMAFQRPETNRSFDEAVQLCESKGAGWHLITNDEWAGLALLSQALGTLPHGNTNHGADFYCPEEKGVTYNNSKTLTGSGPITWNHDHTPEGVTDMCGNIWEFVGGLRFLAGEVQIIPNNEAAAGADQSRDSKEWTPIYTVDGDTVNYSVRNEEIKIKPIPTGKRCFTGAPFSCLNDTEIDIPHELVEMGLYPAENYKGKDRFWLYNDEDDEVCVCRGGAWGNEMYAGIFSLNASNARTEHYTNIGFRLAYVRYSEESPGMRKYSNEINTKSKLKMTAQEAKRIIKNEKQCVEKAVSGCNRNYENCKLVLPDSEILEAYDFAISAIDKQTPQKLEYEADGCDENGKLIYDTAYCPECHHEFEEGVNDWGVEHCPCGQALDWSDNE